MLLLDVTRLHLSAGKVISLHVRAGIHIHRPLKPSSHFHTLERFTVILCHKVSALVLVNEAYRKQIIEESSSCPPPTCNKLSFRQTLGPPAYRTSRTFPYLKSGVGGSRKIIGSQYR